MLVRTCCPSSFRLPILQNPHIILPPRRLSGLHDLPHHQQLLDASEVRRPPVSRRTPTHSRNRVHGAAQSAEHALSLHCPPCHTRSIACCTQFPRICRSQERDGPHAAAARLPRPQAVPPLRRVPAPMRRMRSCTPAAATSGPTSATRTSSRAHCPRVPRLPIASTAQCTSVEGYDRCVMEPRFREDITRRHPLPESDGSGERPRKVGEYLISKWRPSMGRSAGSRSRRRGSRCG